jgi:hypothetical protein
MRTRHFAVLAGLALSAACSPKPPTVNGQEQARLRNMLPLDCTDANIKACPAPTPESCNSGEELVLDYSMDCCVHYSCQPICAAAQSCKPTPAPRCGDKSHLWIGTALEDCCPAYRCVPDSTACDPKTAVCDQVIPYCGEGVMPIVTGSTSDCCPIYQCPCDILFDSKGQPSSVNANCGCTYPTCRPDEELACEGLDRCKGPCICKPRPGACTKDADCANDQKCQLTVCSGGSGSTTTMPPCNDSVLCGPAPAMSSKLCSDGKTTSGPTCVVFPDGKCGWITTECPSAPTAECHGFCVASKPPPAQGGCAADSDCGSNQTCRKTCQGWMCSGNTGSKDNSCSCPANDPNCKCDATGTTCESQTCTGVCVDVPKCDPNKPIACPALAVLCPGGVKPEVVGTDPTTCCPIEMCPSCAVSSNVRSTCAVPAIDSTNCPCLVLKETDPATCCPIYRCGKVDGNTGKCL